MVPKPVKPAGKRISFARIGPGRPANLPATPVSEAEIARVAETGQTTAEMAHYHRARSIAVLLQVAEQGTSEIARVSAARALANLAKDHKPTAPKSKEESVWDELLNS